jgi:hypothetical protein
MEGRANAPAGPVGGVAAPRFWNEERGVYYVRAATRGSDSARRGTPRQAIAYITGSRDEWRDPGMSPKELEFVARIGPEWTGRGALVSIGRERRNWADAAVSALAYLGRHEDGPKREVEGGRVPLVGFGTLAGDWQDERHLTANFQWDCFPWHVNRGKAGYKSFTLTLPKEVSLFAEGHRQAAKAVMCDAAAATLEDAFPGLDVSAVGAIHTRSESGEVHFHMHLLVAKFARHRTTDRMVSINSQAGGNTGRRIWELKRAWQKHIDRLLKERLGIEVEQVSRHGPVALRLRDGTRLAPLGQDSRRVLEKLLVAGQSSSGTGGSGRETSAAAPGRSAAPRKIKLGVMDDRIYEVASGRNGLARWSAVAFIDLFPEHARFVGRYEKRVLSLERAGYLTADGRVTADFSVHYGLRRGVQSPELHAIRADLRREAEHESQEFGTPARVASIGEAMDWNPGVRSRIERLGLSREEVRRKEEEICRLTPTRDQLKQIRKNHPGRHAAVPAAVEFPHDMKGLVRAFVDVQAARVRWVLAVSTGILTLDLGQRRNIAEAMLRAARGRLALAHEQRLARAGSRLRPWFWAIRVVAPRGVRRLEIAIDRCARLARSQDVQTLYRNAVRNARAGRTDTPLDPRLQDLAGVPFAIEVPTSDAHMLLQEVERRVIPAAAPEPVRSPIPTAPSSQGVVKGHAPAPGIISAAGTEDPDRDKRWLQRGLEVLAHHGPHKASTLAAADGRGLGVREEALRIGRLLDRADRLQRRQSLPAVFEQERGRLECIAARLDALGLHSPFTQEVLTGIAPAAIRRALDEFDKAGLLSEGGQWTLKEVFARTLTKEWTSRLQRQLEQDLDR